MANHITETVVHMVISSQVASSSLGTTYPFKDKLNTEHLCASNKIQEQVQQKTDQPTWHTNIDKAFSCGDKCVLTCRCINKMNFCKSGHIHS